MATTKTERKYPRVYFDFKHPTMTKQSFAKEVNINNIMSRFQRTGAIDHYAKHAGNYDDVSGPDLLDAQLIIANANTMFEELPSSIRKKFENDPSKFYDFVQDDKNHDEMVELGLISSPPTIIEEPSPLVQPSEPDGTQSEPVSTATEDTNTSE